MIQAKLLNRRLAYLERINPEVAQIKKTSLTNIEQGWEYVKLLLNKIDLQDSPAEIWLNKKYHLLEENQFIQSRDARPIASALVYLAGLFTGEQISKKTIIQLMKPMTENSLNETIEELKELLNL